MGRFFWGSSIIAAGAVIYGLGAFAEMKAQNATPVAASVEVAFVEPEIGQPAELAVGSTGSALATAAFGLSALQPETYNGEIVLNIIKASPLEMMEKDRLSAKLIAAESGHGELPQVLAAIRVSLAVD